MSEFLIAFVQYFGALILLTLGIPVICGLAVGLCSSVFSRLMGSGSRAVFDLTAIIGTPVHELGHAVMCPLFGHRIEKMRLWSPFSENGMYGFVDHSYNKRNPWALLGNLFIGLGPIFSGMLVTVLMLRFCFPEQWLSYLTLSKETLQLETASDVLKSLLALLKMLPKAFMEHPWRSLLGLAVILPISLHISLSWLDIKGSLMAMPIYLLLTLLFALVTQLIGIDRVMTSWLSLLNLRLASLFCVVLAFSVLWVLLGLLIRGIKIVVSWF